MKFTTPCYVRVEDMEKRKELIAWLNQLGYNIYDWYWGRCIRIIRCWNTPKGVSKAVGCPCKQVRKTDIDCGENIELFKALAAMTDDRDDVNQWYVFAADYYFGEEDVYYHRGHVISGIDMIYVFEDWRNALYYCRKATADEIIKHLKKS